MRTHLVRRAGRLLPRTRCVINIIIIIIIIIIILTIIGRNLVRRAGRLLPQIHAAAVVGLRHNMV